MSDNIQAKDRNNSPISIAAKDAAGVYVPRNLLVRPDGTDVTPVDAGDFGLRADTAATDDTGSWSLIALAKRLSGSTTALLARLPASLGGKAAAGSLSVVPATDSASANASTATYAASLVVKASAGALWGLSGFNSGSSALYLQIHDAAALPADGAVPKVVLYIAPLSSFSADYGLRGRAFTNGIVICSSSTGPVKTGGGAVLWLDAQFS
jgi:hypothetical protein